MALNGLLILLSIPLGHLNIYNKLPVHLINTVIMTLIRLLILSFIPLWSSIHLYFYAITFLKRKQKFCYC
jgi:hypothetical protein